MINNRNISEKRQWSENAKTEATIGKERKIKALKKKKIALKKKKSSFAKREFSKYSKSVAHQIWKYRRNGRHNEAKTYKLSRPIWSRNQNSKYWGQIERGKVKMS